MKVIGETAMPMQQGAGSVPRDMALVMVWMTGQSSAATFQAQLSSAEELEKDFERGLRDSYVLELYAQPTGRRTRVTFRHGALIAVAVDRASVSPALLHGA